MSKQTITIDIDVRDGYELKYNLETRTIKEVKKEPTRSKSWEEFCRHNPKIQGEYYLTSTGNINTVTTYNSRVYANTLVTKEDVEGILALIQLTRLHDEWVGDWKPIGGKDHYAITYNLERKEFVTETWWSTLNILSFPTKEMALEFFVCFKDLIYKAKRFI